MIRLLLYLIVILLAIPDVSWGQEYVVGSISGPQGKLIGANVFWKSSNKGSISNEVGNFKIKFNGPDSLCFRYIGYKSICVWVPKPSTVNIKLKESAITTDEVVITGAKSDLTRGTQMSTQTMSLQQIEELPSFLGEVDILKSIQLLPGVQSAGEGNSGFYVRGGGPDQNLILLDKAPVYNASHLLGLFSIFNHQAIGDPTLIKGGMPARFGNRLASVLEIPTKNGNFNKHEFGGGIGLVASRLYASGPILKDKVSYLITGRRTYIDALAAPFIPDDSQAKGSAYYFYDLNAQISAKLSDNDQVKVGFYLGDDVFKFLNKGSDISLRIPWGNLVLQGIYNRKFSNKLNADFYAYYDQYQFALQSQFDQFVIGVSSEINDYSLGSDWTFLPNSNHLVKFGVQLSRNKYLPSFAEASSGETDFDTGEKNYLHSNQYAAYIQDEWIISPIFTVNIGLRYSLFQHLGPYIRYDQRGENELPIIRRFGKGYIIKTYDGLEPRLAAKYSLTENSALKASFTQNYQYLHLASISPVSLPTDIWIPSTSRIKPQNGQQYALGYFHELSAIQSQFSIETYYKSMKNLVEYKDNVNPEDNLNDNVDNQLIQGKGYSYGVEFYFKKKAGKFNGWIGYTWSRTRRIFEELNEGRSFPAKYDRTHDLSLAATYQASKKWTFGANFVFGTGNAISLPTTRYFSFLDGRVLGVYKDRNSFRMPNYHRFDISATLRPKKNENRKYQSWWVFSLYNVYSRQNPYFLYFDAEGTLGSNDLKLTAKQVSLFPILPSVTWNFAF
ncbi:TonB-dependent receptor [Luteibaculum oceani]|uniref:TonB-dependent receptor n=1 Tax=Luteibaculum oceani TaxID=1294296 RepID=A0A5C6V9H0_9FLAO|nr:TonB-dependent receptor [Luteibaculum oceani]TXC81344.1 TonB-dependent receptor [Luteibaculum oceani]